MKFPLLWKFYFSKWKFYFSADKIGNAKEIGINNILKADFGDDPIIKEGEIPVFWACGVTPQNVIMKAKLPFVITHAPGHMFISDILNSSLKS
ncbi:DUF1445 domain-containing protein [Campylobacter coli]|nr:DUF1445 domain-containing protein [Campylobacter coli]ELE3191471.1 DUF1445 domain-containing protein [Campylobacter coli]